MENITKERIVDEAIRIIDEKGGALHVNLREIARNIGCSAPNLYNYFNSLDDLMNTALIRICEDFIETIRRKTTLTGDNEDLEGLAFRAYIQYALENPGRLNFYHFERLSFSISTEGQIQAEKVGEHMAGLLYSGLQGKLSYEKALTLTSLLHKFLLGSLSDYITGRVKIDDQEQYVSELTTLCKKILKSLIDNFPGEQEV